MEMKMVKELMLQSLEHEMGGVQVYETALKCVLNDDLKEEWEKYLEETENHVADPARRLSRRSSIDPEAQTPGPRDRRVDMGAALVAAMEDGQGRRQARSGPARRVRVRRARRDQGPPRTGS